MLPLEGLKIVELRHDIAGPFATRLLADMGAEVIKVEPPEGDPIQRIGLGPEVLQAAIAAWTGGRDTKSAQAVLEASCSRLFDMRDCAEDAHLAHEMILPTQDPLIGPILHPAPPFRFDGVAPADMLGWTAPAVGAHNDHVFGTLLGEPA